MTLLLARLHARAPPRRCSRRSARRAASSPTSARAAAAQRIERIAPLFPKLERARAAERRGRRRALDPRPAQALRRRRRRSRGVDLEVGAGQLVGLLGPNGAGKTTLTKIACGLAAPSAGDVEVVRRARRAASRRAPATGYLAELFRFPGWLTRRRAARAAPAARRLGRRRAPSAASCSSWSASPTPRDQRVERDVEGDAAAARDRPGADRLAAAPAARRADERARPGRAADRPRRCSRRLRSRGIAVLLNSHLLSEVERVCDSVTIIARGARRRQRAAGGARPARAASRSTPTAGSSASRASTRDGIPKLVAELVADGPQRLRGPRDRLDPRGRLPRGGRRGESRMSAVDAGAPSQAPRGGDHRRPRAARGGPAARAASSSRR